MSENLFKLWTTQFTTNIELLLQQMGTLLRSHVTEGYHVGKQASPINQVGAIQMKSPAGRFAPLNRTDADYTRRWVFPTDKETAQMVDSFNELKTIVDPKSPLVKSAGEAVGREWDDGIIAAAFGIAQIGQDAGGLSAETFDTTKFTVAGTFGSSGGATDIGLTVEKMIETKRIFRHFHNELDRDPLTLVIGSQQESDLLNLVQVVSTEYNDRPVLVDGSIKRFLGFDIVVSERVQMNTNGTDRNCIAFVKSGLYLGIWKDTYNRVSIREDLSSQPYQIYTQMSYGVTRTQPGKVMQVLCKDSTGADITP